MRVVFFQRKRPVAFFSLEEVFDRVRSAQPNGTSCLVKTLTFQSSGFLKRVYGCLEAMLSQGDVNHVTGDIHFITPFLAKSKTILTIHDLGFLNSKNELFRTIYLWIWVKIPVRRAALITTVSEVTKQEVLRHCRVDAEKIKVIYNPISPLFSRSVRAFNKTKPTILQVGVTPNKNITRLILALKGMTCKLIVLGKLDSEIRTLLVKEGIEFAEYFNLKTEEVIKLYHVCDVLAFVSIVEGFGLPIIEANAVGRVVVTSNISAMPEVAGNAAHFVDPYDISSIRNGLVRVIEDEQYRNLLVFNGYENTKRFNLQSIANNYNSLYSQVMQGQGLNK